MKKHTEQEDVFKELQDEKYSAIMQKFNNKFLELANENCHTSKMWVEYFQMTTLLRKFIEASRCGFFEQHVQCVIQMLLIFHASGHNLYAKAAHIIT